MSNRLRNKKGFTLIELMVVVAIIGILGSAIIVNLIGARKRAIDARKISELMSLQKGLALFYESYGRMPGNYGPGGACEDAAFDTSMQELINAGILRDIPHSPDEQPYCYFNYNDPDNPSIRHIIGGVLATNLMSTAPSKTGRMESCRPWNVSTNWCNNAVDNYWYCLCTPYD